MNKKWKEYKIRCYVVGKGRNFAFPLTITCWKKKTDFIDTLTHELIHNLERQNLGKLKPWRDYVQKNYGSEPKSTKSHLLVHTIHHEILLKFFNKARLNHNIRKSDNMPEYARSWEIVIEEGAKNILKRFREVIKS
jgi:antirestriction protein ArdC